VNGDVDWRYNFQSTLTVYCDIQDVNLLISKRWFVYAIEEQTKQCYKLNELPFVLNYNYSTKSGYELIFNFYENNPQMMDNSFQINPMCKGYDIQMIDSITYRNGELTDYIDAKLDVSFDGENVNCELSVLIPYDWNRYNRIIPFENESQITVTLTNGNYFKFNAMRPSVENDTIIWQGYSNIGMGGLGGASGSEMGGAGNDPLMPSDIFTYVEIPDEFICVEYSGDTPTPPTPVYELPEDSIINYNLKDLYLNTSTNKYEIPNTAPYKNYISSDYDLQLSANTSAVSSTTSGTDGIYMAANTSTKYLSKTSSNLVRPRTDQVITFLQKTKGTASSIYIRGSYYLLRINPNHNFDLVMDTTSRGPNYPTDDTTISEHIFDGSGKVWVVNVRDKNTGAIIATATGDFTKVAYSNTYAQKWGMNGSEYAGETSENNYYWQYAIKRRLTESEISDIINFNKTN
jgi:hypothetical protein